MKQGPFIFGLCMTGNHNRCPGGLRAPGKVVYCECECHAGQEITVPEQVVITREVQPGKRDRKLAEQLGDALEADGYVEIDAPTDERELTNAKQRLYNVARKRAIKIRVTLQDGKLVATLKGETRQQEQTTEKGTNDMKVAVHTGELPKRQVGGRTRAANPFDALIEDGGTHKVTLEKGDDAAVIKRQLQNAARFGGKSVTTFTDKDSIIFKVVPKRTRKTTEKK